MLECGRVRKPIGNGWTQLIENELNNLQVAAVSLEPGESYTLNSRERELALILVYGDCDSRTESGLRFHLGPRRNPFEDLPYGVFVPRDETITLSANQQTFLGVGSSPALRATSPTYMTPDRIVVGTRGAENWEREVRKVFWSDNSEGDLLLAGETCTRSGNWSTIPPHRHQYDLEGREAPYEEVYLFQFSRPQGFGLIWQFDDKGDLDQAFSLKTNDAVYISRGYHPVVCAPGSTLYHLTFMAGPRRISQASVHPDYQFLLDEVNLANQFTPK